MTTTTMYLIRHGEAAHDDESTDPGLSPLGRAQAFAAGQRFARLSPQPPIRHVLHGTRRRAAETAAIVAASNPSWQTSDSEHLEDRTPIPDTWTAMPERYHEFLRSVPPDEQDVGGRRLDEALAALSGLDDTDRTVVAVTHSFVIAWFVRSVLESPSWRWVSLPVTNGALTILQWSNDREPRLLAFDDTGHLPT